jgi:hypothetical protein
MNPNEYDDEAFTDASITFQSSAHHLLIDLWGAGASSTDIINEINDALANAGISDQRGERLEVVSR